MRDQKQKQSSQVFFSVCVCACIRVGGSCVIDMWHTWICEATCELDVSFCFRAQCQPTRKRGLLLIQMSSVTCMHGCNAYKQVTHLFGLKHFADKKRVEWDIFLTRREECHWDMACYSIRPRISLILIIYVISHHLIRMAAFQLYGYVVHTNTHKHHT